MLIQNTTSDLLAVITTSANAVQVYAAAVDTTTTTCVTVRQRTSIAAIVASPGTTFLAAPAASTDRVLKYASIVATGGANTVTPVWTDGTPIQMVGPVSLATGERLEYVDTVGWRAFDASGQLKTNVSGGGRLLRSTFVTATASPFILLADTRGVKVTLWGGAGAGGGAPVNVANNASAGTGGNCGGRVEFFGPQTGSFVFAIGAAGAVGAAGAAGGNGGNTTATVNGVALSATGGTGGAIQATAAVKAQTQPPAAVSGSGAGAKVTNGPRGEWANVLSFVAASPLIDAMGGKGGAYEELGAAGPGRSSATGAGGAATGFGCGGGGASSLSGGAAQVGGAAGGGAMLVDEYS